MAHLALDFQYPVVFVHSHFWISFFAIGSLPFMFAFLASIVALLSMAWSFITLIPLVIAGFSGTCATVLITTVLYRVEIDQNSVMTRGLITDKIFWNDVENIDCEEAQAITMRLKCGRRKTITLHNSNEKTELLRHCLVQCFTGTQKIVG